MSNRINNLSCVSQKVGTQDGKIPRQPPATLIVVPQYLQTWELLETCYFFGIGIG